MINSILTNSEAWYDIKDAEIETLEKVDESLLRQILETPSSTPKEMLYLELGLTPIRYIIKSRRLNFLHYILQQDQESLLYRCFSAQKENPVKNDWTETVKSDLELLEFEEGIDGVKAMTKDQFKKAVKKAVTRKALLYLNEKKSKHSKVLHIQHENLELQDYLEPNEIGIEMSKFIFSARSRMLDLKCNFQNSHSDLLCVACKEEEDSQEHLLECKVLNDENTVVDKVPIYADLFEDNLDKKIAVSSLLKKSFMKRKFLK